MRVGVSSCLLGNQVRYDGQHKRDDFVCDVLGKFVELVPICPEVELGMGIPREPVRLVKQGERSRMVGVKTERDFTGAMVAWADRRVRALVAEGLSGYVLKKDSPSCGMARVKRYARQVDAPPTRDGTGLFAEALQRHLPNLPVEEEGRLNDVGVRENFLERVFAYHRWRTLIAGRWTVGALVAFHTAHKLALLAHSPEAYRRLGHLVGEAKRLPRAELRDRYEAAFMAALRRPATRGRHSNVLQHMVGYFKKTLDQPARRELQDLIAQYREGLVPLVVPLALLRHHVSRLDVAYLADQVYLSPHPEVLRSIGWVASRAIPAEGRSESTARRGGKK
jgi:uncharacterized protein YbgA (DUF1722 family)/uncharacterized protein YbbK (DUF523 family)